MPERVRVHRLVSAASRFLLAVGFPRRQAGRALRDEYARLNAFLRAERIAFRADPRRVSEYVARWDAWVERHFDPADPDAFYASWTDEVGALGLAVNVHDQLRRVEVLATLRAFDFRGKRLLDLGAGSSAIHAFTRGVRELVLCDVENLAARYNRFKLAPHARFIGLDALAREAPGSFDAIVCLDVLEHLRTPSRVLRETIHPLLRTGGALFLQAPWGGGVREHLPEAPLDWKRDGGAALLRAAFRRTHVINPLIALYAPSGVYVKR